MRIRLRCQDPRPQAKEELNEAPNEATRTIHSKALYTATLLASTSYQLKLSSITPLTGQAAQYLACLTKYVEGLLPGYRIPDVSGLRGTSHERTYLCVSRLILDLRANVQKATRLDRQEKATAFEDLLLTPRALTRAHRIIRFNAGLPLQFALKPNGQWTAMPLEVDELARKCWDPMFEANPTSHQRSAERYIDFVPPSISNET